MKYLPLVTILVLISLQHVSGELLFVIEQFRHGARGPLSKYYDYYEQIQIAGQLTPTGIRQHYVLGTELRKSYIEQQQFLSSTYSHSQIYVLSTDVNRTIMSALSQLAGLYPVPTGPDVPTNLTSQDYLLPPFQGLNYTDQGLKALDLGFQTIPIHSQSHNPGLDPMHFCKNASSILSKWKKEPKQQYILDKFNEEFQPTAQQIGKLINYTNISVSQLPGVNSNFQCDRYNGRPLPQGLTPELNRNLSYVSDFLGYFDMNCPTYRKIANTNLFLDYISRLDAAQQGKSSLKWYMVSAHDTNLQYVLPFLNITSTDCITDVFNFTIPSVNCEPLPEFAASLIIELHKINEQFQVMIKYNGVYQKLCGTNSTICLYSTWRNLIVSSIYTPEQFNTVCGNPNTSLITDSLYTRGVEEEIETHELITESSEFQQQVIIQANHSPLSEQETPGLRIAIIIIQSLGIVFLSLRLARKRVFAQKKSLAQSDNQQTLISTQN